MILIVLMISVQAAHPHIAQCLGGFEDNGSIFLVTEQMNTYTIFASMYYLYVLLLLLIVLLLVVVVAALVAVLLLLLLSIILLLSLLLTVYVLT